MLLGTELGLQVDLKLTELWRGLLLTCIHRICGRVQMLLHRWPGELKASSNRTNALVANQIPTPNFSNYIYR
jgi:hypothetical protein